MVRPNNSNDKDAGSVFPAKPDDVAGIGELACRDKLYIYTDNRRGYVTARYILDRHFTPGVEYIDPSGTIRM